MEQVEESTESSLEYPAMEQVEEWQQSTESSLEQVEQSQHVENHPVLQLSLILDLFSWIRRSANWEALFVALAVATATAAPFGPNFQATASSQLGGYWLGHSNSNSNSLVPSGSVVEQALSYFEGR